VASLVALYLALVLNANDAAAQATFQWINNTGGNWTDNSNWLLISGMDVGNNGYPDNGDNAIFVNLPSTQTIINAGQTLGTLTLSGSAQVILDLEGNDLTTTGAFSVTGTGLIRIEDGNFNPNSVKRLQRHGGNPVGVHGQYHHCCQRRHFDFGIRNDYIY
jgi:hypothetical protein